MKFHADEAALIELIGSLGQVDTRDKLLSWVRKDMQEVLPHHAFICGMWRVHRAGVAPIKLFAWNFPADYLQTLKQPDGLYVSPVIRNWLASGEVQLLDIDETAAMGLDSGWLQRFRDSGLTNIAAHGVHDYTRQHASYFSFHQIPETLGQRHRWVLGILVPPMHAALLRVLHKIKAEARAAHTGRALTARELEVLAWICEGKTSAEISDILGVARNTVRNQIQSILVKLRVNTRAQAAAKAIKKGLVVPQHPDSQFGAF